MPWYCWYGTPDNFFQSSSLYLFFVINVVIETSTQITVTWQHLEIQSRDCHRTKICGCWLITDCSSGTHCTACHQAKQSRHPVSDVRSLCVSTVPLIQSVHNSLSGFFIFLYHWSIFWATWIQSIPSHSTFLRSILITATHVCPGFQSGLFPSGFLINFLYSHMCYMLNPPHPLCKVIWTFRWRPPCMLLPNLIRLTVWLIDKWSQTCK